MTNEIINKKSKILKFSVEKPTIIAKGCLCLIQKKLCRLLLKEQPDYLKYYQYLTLQNNQNSNDRSNSKGRKKIKSSSFIIAKKFKND